MGEAINNTGITKNSAKRVCLVGKELEENTKLNWLLTGKFLSYYQGIE